MLGPGFENRVLVNIPAAKYPSPTFWVAGDAAESAHDLNPSLRAYPERYPVNNEQLGLLVLYDLRTSCSGS